MKNEINRIASRLVKAFNTNTVINPIPVKYCKNINLANKLRKLCEDQIKDEQGGEMGAPEDDGMFAHNDPTQGDK